jgi:hypothetical protein
VSFLFGFKLRSVRPIPFRPQIRLLTFGRVGEKMEAIGALATSSIE